MISFDNMWVKKSKKKKNKGYNMPCIVYESEYEIAERKKKETQAQNEKFNALKNHADKVTQLLCSVMGKLEYINEFTENGVSVDDIDVDSCKEAVQSILSDKLLQTWRKKHQEADRKAASELKRKENKIKNDEKLKARALSKLTKAERLALGIKD